MDYTRLSRFLSLILRHKPEEIGIHLDEHGWANVDELINNINKSNRYTIDIDILDEIVTTDEKQRYSFNANKTKIRANQGHSINVDVELKEKEPPEILYHGSSTKYANRIAKEGLKPQSRLYVHISNDLETAKKVGSRHGKPKVYKILAKQMFDNKYKFYLSKNNVWMTKEVPVKYLRQC